jgi:hypothetical protein
VTGTGPALEEAGDLAPGHLHLGRAVRIHLVDTRREHDVDAAALEQVEIGVEIARVLREILVGAELGGVHEDRDDDRLAELGGTVDEGEVTLVQSAERRHECDGGGVRERLAQSDDRLDDDGPAHGASSAPSPAEDARSIVVAASTPA